MGIFDQQTREIFRVLLAGTMVFYAIVAHTKKVGTTLYLLRRPVERVFSRAGVTINGTQPWDIKVLDKRFYGQVLTTGSLGLGESYMRQYWTTENLEELFYRLVSSGLEQTSKRTPKQFFLGWAANLLTSRPTKNRKRMPNITTISATTYFSSFWAAIKTTAAVIIKMGSSEFPMGKSQTMVKNVVQESFFMEIFK